MESGFYHTTKVMKRMSAKEINLAINRLGPYLYNMQNALFLDKHHSNFTIEQGLSRIEISILCAKNSITRWKQINYR